MSKEHKCFRDTDRRLRSVNTRLVRNMFNTNHLVIATERIENLRDGKRATVVVASYCPFCGAKLEAT